MRNRIAAFALAVFVLVLATGFMPGCTPAEKKPDPDAFKREAEKLKKEREQEWGK